MPIYTVGIEIEVDAPTAAQALRSVMPTLRAARAVAEIDPHVRLHAPDPRPVVLVRCRAQDVANEYARLAFKGLKLITDGSGT
jgi:hypothetical protein